MGNGTRYKRFAQYRLYPVAAEDSWGIEAARHRDYTTFKKFNPVGGRIRPPTSPSRWTSPR